MFRSPPKGRKGPQDTDQSNEERSYQTRKERIQSTGAYKEDIPIDSRRKKQIPESDIVTRSKVRSVSNYTSRTSPIRTRNSPPKPDSITPIVASKGAVAFTIENTPVENRTLRRSPRLSSTPIEKPTNVTQVLDNVSDFSRAIEKIVVEAEVHSPNQQENNEQFSSSAGSNIVDISSERDYIHIEHIPIPEPELQEQDKSEPAIIVEPTIVTEDPPATVVETATAGVQEAIVEKQTSTVVESTPAATVVSTTTATPITTPVVQATRVTEPVVSETTVTTPVTLAEPVKRIQSIRPVFTGETPTVNATVTIIRQKDTTVTSEQTSTQETGTMAGAKADVILNLMGQSYVLSDDSCDGPYKELEARVNSVMDVWKKDKDQYINDPDKLNEVIRMCKRYGMHLSTYENFAQKYELPIPSTEWMRIGIQTLRIKATDRLMALLQMENQDLEKQKEQDRVDLIQHVREQSTGTSAGGAKPVEDPKKRAEPEKVAAAKPTAPAQKSARYVPRKTVQLSDSSDSESINSEHSSSDQSDVSEHSDVSEQEEDEIPPRGARRAHAYRAPGRDRDILALVTSLQDEIRMLKKKSQKRKPAPMTVQPFGGERADYLRFKTAFKSTYEDVGLSKVELAIRLGECLKGEPKQRYGFMADDATNSTYAAMWKNLDVFYGTREKQKLSKLDKFTRMPDIKTFNANTVSLLYATLENNWSILKDTLKADFETGDNYLFHSFLKKLPLQEVVRYKENCKALHRVRTFSTFKRWLKHQYNYLSEDKSRDRAPVDKGLQYWHLDKEEEVGASYFEKLALSTEGETLTVASSDCSLVYDDDGTHTTYLAPSEGALVLYKDGEYKKVNRLRVPSNTVGGAAAAATRVRLNDPTKTIKPSKEKKPDAKTVCYHCSKHDHPVYKCESFAKASMAARLNTVIENRLCFRCLNKGHSARECRVRFLCDIDKCGKRHHRLLHSKEVSKRYCQYLCQQGLGSDLDSDIDD